MDAIAQAMRDAVRDAVTESVPALIHASAPRLMTIEQAAKYLACSPGQVRNLIAAGILPTVRWPNEGTRRKPYLDRRDLDAIIDQMKSREVNGAA